MSLLLCCASCSSKPKVDPTNIHKVFRTLITADNTKRFELNFMPKKVRMPSPYDPSVRQPPSRGLSEKELKKRLKAAMEITQFCRDGYLILGRYAGQKTNRLRGECKEKATGEDKIKFKNTILEW